MLNLSQRLIIGCVLLACLMAALVGATHQALVASGQAYLAYGFIAAAIVVAMATVYFVLSPVHTVARDAKRIAEGNLEHRVEWSSHDDFGVIAAELGRISVRLRELRDTDAGRRQMEFQLSDAVLQSIFEPIIVTDSKGHVLKLNQAAAELLGEAAGDRLALANTPGGDKILNSIRDAVSLQKAVAAEGEASMLPMRIGTQQRSYRLRTTPMRDSEGRLLGAVTTLEDVTSLQDTDRFKSQFISVASRKLRDPLLRLRRGLYALMQGFSGDLLPLQAEIAAHASSEAESLNDLMNDLIEVAEIDSGKREFKLVKIRPLVALTEARDRYVDEAARKNIRLDVSAYADLAVVLADKRALRSILDNLLSNALRYTPPDGEILLAAEEVRDSVQFTVRDTGRGIEADRLGSIFDRFNVFSESASSMGLALVRRLVESLGGQIAVESKLGNGATFRFTLPVAVTAEAHHPVEVGLMAELTLEKNPEPAKLRVYIGAAPGVGKTYHMLNDAHLMRDQEHIEVVLGLIETHGRKETQERIRDLEIVPLKEIPYHGVTLKEMDVDAIIARHPNTVVVDELAHTNVPGSKNRKRYEDVLELLDAGINVMTAVNIQHLETLNDAVNRSANTTIRETIPDSFLKRADEVMNIDITVEELRARLRQGKIYAPEKVEQSLANFFRKGNLNMLRELSLRTTAEQVSNRASEYRRTQGLEQAPIPEKVMVCLSTRPGTERLLRVGARVAGRLATNWYAVYVTPPDDKGHGDPEAQQRLDEYRRMARDLGAKVVSLTDKNVSDALIHFAQQENISHVIFGQTARSRWDILLRGSVLNRFLSEVRDVTVQVVPMQKPLRRA